MNIKKRGELIWFALVALALLLSSCSLNEITGFAVLDENATANETAAEAAPTAETAAAAEEKDKKEKEGKPEKEDKREEKPKENVPPVWKSDVEEFTLKGATTIDLSEYFHDANNDSLAYLYTTPEKIEIDVDGSIVTLTPKGNNFTAAISFTATDGDKATTKEITLIVPEKSITINLEYKSGSSYDIDNDGYEPTEGAVDLTVENSQFSWDADKSKLCSLWKLNPVEAEETTTICYGSEKCCNFVGLSPTRDAWDEVFFSIYGQYGALLDNEVSSQVIYADYGLSIDEPFAEIYYSEWKSLPARYYFASIDFENVCVDTCVLEGFNDTSYKLIFEIDNAILNLDMLTYSIAEEISNVKLELGVEDDTGLSSGSYQLYKDNVVVSVAEGFVEPDYYDIEVTPTENVIDRLFIQNVNVTEPLSASIGIDNVSREILIESVDVKKRYAVNLEELEFEKATLTATASASSLFKCRQWDYDSEVCFGEWVKIKDLVVGQEYDLTLTADDPGFIEGDSNITIVPLNITNATEIALIKDIANITIIINKNSTIDLSEYFSNIDENTIFTYFDAEGIAILFENGIATIVPAQDFIGTAYTFITAAREGRSAVSNVFSIIVTNATIEITPIIILDRKDFMLDEDVEVEFEYLTKQKLVENDKWKEEYEVYEEETEKTEEELKLFREKITEEEKLLSEAEKSVKKQNKKWQKANESIEAFVYDNSGSVKDINVEIEELREGKFDIKIPKPRAFKAGKYTIKLDLIKDGIAYSQEQDFTWGVLAVNVNKSIYLPNEDSFIGIGVLDDQGKIICNADVTLEITNPSNQKTTLTTANNEIKISPECTYLGVTELPDYYASYSVNGVGAYLMNLTAVTSNGIRSVQDNFTVQSSVDFDVARKSQTRIYPLVPYTMDISVTANQNYNGVINEYVPSSFEISEIEFIEVSEENKGSETTLSAVEVLKIDENLIEKTENDKEKGFRGHLTLTSLNSDESPAFNDDINKYLNVCIESENDECKGRVAQRIEHLSDSGEDAGSNFERKSRRAHTDLADNKEKQAHSLDKEPLRLRGISHDFALDSETAESHTVELNEHINYKNVSILNEVNKKEENGFHSQANAPKQNLLSPRTRGINQNLFKYLSSANLIKNKEKGSQNQAVEPKVRSHLETTEYEQLFKPFGLEEWETVGWQNQALRSTINRVGSHLSGFKADTSVDVPALPSTNSRTLIGNANSITIKNNSKKTTLSLKSIDENNQNIINKLSDFFSLIPSAIAQSSPYTINTIGDTKIISIQANLKKGSKYVVSYKFDAPDTSPEFYLLGPLQIGAFAEKRNWQIANDQFAGFSYNITYPDAGAPGMNIVVQFVSGTNFTEANNVQVNSSGNITIGPIILTASNGNWVTTNGEVMTTVFYIHPNASPQNVNVSIGGQSWSVFQIINVTTKSDHAGGKGNFSWLSSGNYMIGDGNNGTRTLMGAIVLDSLIIPSGVTVTVNTTDLDSTLVGEQGYLPVHIIVDGPVNISGILNVSGVSGDNVASGAAGQRGGPGGPGGGGGGSGASDAATGPSGGNGFTGGGGGGCDENCIEGAGGNGTGSFGGKGSTGTTTNTVGGGGGNSTSPRVVGGGGGVTAGTTGGAGGGGTGFFFGRSGEGGGSAALGAGGSGGGGGARLGAANRGGGGGFGTAGVDGTLAGSGGSVNGNTQLVPLTGGSGGGGGSSSTTIGGGGGGGGGGAVLIFAKENITIMPTGQILALGGGGGNGAAAGGGGSGGAIVLQAFNVTVNGILNTSFGRNKTTDSARGGFGRIRVDGLASPVRFDWGGTAGSNFTGPAIKNISDTGISGTANASAKIIVYVRNQTHADGQAIANATFTQTAASNGQFNIDVTWYAGRNYIAVIQNDSTQNTYTVLSSAAAATYDFVPAPPPPDNTPPVVNTTFNVTSPLVDDAINFTGNITDNVQLLSANITFNLSGVITYMNYTLSSAKAQVSNKTNLSGCVETCVINFTMYATDTNNNVKQNSTLLKVNDVTKPIVNTTFNVTSPLENDVINFSGNMTDLAGLISANITYNISGVITYINFSGLSSTTYSAYNVTKLSGGAGSVINFTLYATDTSNNVKQNSTLITIRDVTLPVVNTTFNITSPLVDSVVNFSGNITDDLQLLSANITYNISGVITYINFSSLSGTTYSAYNVTPALGCVETCVINFTMYATDTNNNVKQNSTLLKVNDVTKPVVNTTFNITSPNVDDVINFSGNITDLGGLLSANITYNISGVITYVNFSSLSGTTYSAYNVTKLSGAAGSVINFTMYATDTNNNVKQNSTLVTITDRTAPVVNTTFNVTSPLVNDVVNFSGNVTDDLQLLSANITYNISGIITYVNFTSLSSTTYSPYNVTLALGCIETCVINFTMYATDSSNNVKQNSTLLKVNDVTKPIVNTTFNITSPLVDDVINFSGNITDLAGLISANITYNISGVITYINFSSLSSTTYSAYNVTKLSGGAGSVINFTLYATDTSNNVKQNSTLITIRDAVAPVVNTTFNVTSPVVNDVVNFTGNITDDVGLLSANITYNISGSITYVNFTGLSGTTAQRDNVTKLDCVETCVINFTMYVTDTSNNVKQNSTLLKVNDVTKPIVNTTFNITSPLQNDVINFTGNITDAGGLLSANITYNMSGVITYVNFSGLSSTTAQISNVTKLVGGGTSVINFTMYVTDTSNNVKQNSTLITIRDAVAPVVNTTFNISSPLVDDVINFTGNITDDVGLLSANITYNLSGVVTYVNFTGLSGTTAQISNVTPALGCVETCTINFTMYVTDTSNNVKQNSTLLKVNDVTKPIVNTTFNVTSPLENDVINFSGNMTDLAGLISANITYNISGVLTYVNFTGLSGTTYSAYNVTKLSGGAGSVINFTLYATDTSNNVKQNSTLITIRDVTVPVVNTTFNKTSPLVNDVINFSGNITDDLALLSANITYNISGVITYINFSGLSGTAYSPYNVTLALGCVETCVINFTMYATDTNNNVKQNSTLIKVNDVTKPVVNTTFNITSPVINDIINFTGNITDAGGLLSANITYNMSATDGGPGVITYVNFTSLSGTTTQVSNATKITTGTGSVINFTLYVTDASNNVKQNSTLITVVTADATPPVVNTTFNITTPNIEDVINFTGNITDNLQLFNANITYNISGVLTYVNFSGLSGTTAQISNVTKACSSACVINFTMYATDTNDNVKQNSTLITVTDNRRPVVNTTFNITSPLPNDVINFSGNITDETQLLSANITYNMSGVITYVNFSGLSGTTTQISNVTKLVGGGTSVINFTMYATDTSNNVKQNSTLITIRDAVAPVVNTTFNKTSPLVNDVVNFSGNVTDDVGLFSANITYNISGSITYVNFTGLSGTTAQRDNVTKLDCVETCVINFTMYVTDTSNNVKQNSTLLKVNDVTKPIVNTTFNITSPLPNDVINFTGNVTDGNGLLSANITYNMSGSITYVNFTSLSGTSAQISNVTKLVGGGTSVINFTMYVTDTSNNVKQNSTLITIRDVTKPVVNTTFNKTSPLVDDVINFTGNITDDVGLVSANITYNISGSITYVNFTGLSGTTAQRDNVTKLDCVETCVINFTMYATDTSNNVKQNSTLLKVNDVTKPIVNTTFNITSPLPNDVINFTGNVTDLNGLLSANITYNMSGSITYVNFTSLSGTSAQISNVTKLVGGGTSVINFTMYVTDTSNNVKQNSTLITIRDAVAPVVNTTFNKTSPLVDDVINFTGNITDDVGLVSANITYNISGSITYVNFSGLSGTTAQISNVTKLSCVGTCVINFTMYVTDTSNNVKQNSTLIIIADVTKPVVNTTFNITSPLPNDVINFTGNVTDETELLSANITYNMSGVITYVNFSGLSGTTAQISNVTKLVGGGTSVINFTMYVTDTSNNVKQNSTLITIRDAVAPVVNTTFNVTSPVVNDVVNFSGNITDDVGLFSANITYNISGSITYVNFSGLSGTTAQISNVTKLTCTETCAINFTMYVTDTSNNVKQNSTLLKVNDVTKPIVNTTFNITSPVINDIINFTGNITDAGGLLSANITYNMSGSITYVNFSGLSSTTAQISNVTKLVGGGTSVINFTMYVTDTSNNVKQNSTLITIRDVTKPVVNTTFNKTSPLVDDVINFTGNVTDDVGLLSANITYNLSGVVTYVNFTGLSGTTAQISNVTPALGCVETCTINFTMYVTDTSNNVKQNSTLLKVNDVTKPIVNTTFNITSPLENDVINFSGNITDLGGLISANITYNISGVITYINFTSLSGTTYSPYNVTQALGCVETCVINFTMYATDSGNNVKQNSTLLKVNDVTKPIVNTTFNITSPLENDVINFSGNMTDLAGLISANITYNISGVITYINFSGLSSTTYSAYNVTKLAGGAGSVINFTLYATDANNNVKQNSTLVTIRDVTLPVVNTTFNITSPLVNDVINFTGNITDDLLLLSANITYNLSGAITYVNFTGLSSTTAQISNVTKLNCIETCAVNFTMYATDTSNNVKQNSTLITIADVTKPIVNTTFNITSPLQNDVINFTGNVTDGNGLLSANITYNMSGIITYVNFTGLSGTTAQISNVTKLVGGGTSVINFTMYATDTSNNVKQNSTLIVIREVVAPIVNTTFNITSPLVNDIINFSGNITDDVGLVSANITYNLSGSITYVNFSLSGASAQVSNVTKLNCADNCVINFTMYATDVGNNVKQNSTLVTVADVTKPVVNTTFNITSPLPNDVINFTGNVTDGNGLLSANITYNMSGVITYVNFSGLSGTSTQISNVTKLVGGGTSVINFTMYATDTNNNVKQNSTLITIRDAVVPVVNTTFNITSPVINDIINFTGNVTDDVGLFSANITYNISGSITYVNFTGLSGTATQISNVTLALGCVETCVINFTMYATDTNNNVKQNSTLLKVNDVTKPIVNTTFNITSPLPNDVVNFTGNVTDAGGLLMANITYNISGSITYVNFTGLSGTSTQISNVTPALGCVETCAINFTMYVTDTSNNVKQNSTLLKVNDVTKPVVNTTFNITSPVINDIINFTGNVTDGNGLLSANITYNMSGVITYVNFTSLSGTSAQISNVTKITDVGGAVINFTMYVTDISNNVKQNSTLVSVRDTVFPIVNTTFNITSPLVNDVINFTGNLTDETGLLSANITYNISGSITKVNFTLSGNTAQVSNVTKLDCVETCVINFTMYVTDSSNNVKQNSTLLKVNDVTNPVVNTTFNITSPVINDIINFTGNVTDGNGLLSANITYNMSGVITYVNFTSLSGTSAQISNVTKLVGGGTSVINFTMYVTDTSNNVKQNSTLITIRDVVVPVVNTTFNITSPLVNDVINFTGNITDDIGLLMANITYNLSGTITYVNFTGLSGTSAQMSNVTKLNCVETCVINFTMYATDTSNNVKQNSTLLKVNDVTKPIVNTTFNITSPLVNDMINFSGNITDLGGLISANITYNISGVVTYVNFTSLSGTSAQVSNVTKLSSCVETCAINFTMYATDTSNNVKQNSTIITVADVTKPVVNTTFNVTSPVQNDVINFTGNVTDGNGLLSANITYNMSGVITYVNFSLSGTSAQVSNVTKITDVGGSVINFTMFVTDTNNNVKQNSTLISVRDQISPVVNTTFNITSPLVDDVINFTGNVTDEVGLLSANITYNISGSITKVNFTLSGNIAQVSNVTKLDCVETCVINFTMYVTDSSNNVKQNSTLITVADATKPVVNTTFNITSPKVNDIINFTGNITDGNGLLSANITYNMSGVITYVNFTGLSGTTAQISNSTKVCSSACVINFTMYATDTNNNVKQNSTLIDVVANRAPTIAVNNASGFIVWPLAEGTETVLISFNVTDPDGVNEINASKAVVNLTLGYESGQWRSNVSAVPSSEFGTCYNHTQGDTMIVNCTVIMRYYDNASSNWFVNISIEDINGAVGRNDTQKFTYNELSSISLLHPFINFSIATVGETNVRAYPHIILNNTGNDDFDLINLSAAALIGTTTSSESIPVTGFGVNLTNSSANLRLSFPVDGIVNLRDPVTGGNASLIHGHSGAFAPNADKGNISLFLWVNVPSTGLSSQAYNNTWNITAVDMP